jgi:general L-amino acid transport system permease protein
VPDCSTATNVQEPDVSTIAPIPELRTEETPPFYRDVRVLRWVGQVIVLAAVLGFAWYLFGNVRTNLEASGLPTGFDFLDGRFGSAIPGLPDSADLTVAETFQVGFMNTLRVIVVGIPACTVIGILIGIARLSDNLAVRAFGTTYVETFRNIPVLVWIFIIHFAVAVASLPNITGADNLPGTADDPTYFGLFVVSNRGIGIPWFDPGASGIVFMAGLFVAVLAVWAVNVWRGQVNARTGEPAHGGWWGLGVFVLVALVANFIAGNPMAGEAAALDDTGRQIAGGMTVQVPYFSLTLALTLYTASHVAEIVRGSIQAIHKGQTEAAQAIALTTFQRYRFVILPQAFRIMIPPLANQYLNITKNSSLAVAIGYVEITAIFQRISNNAAPAPQGVLILMGLYLIFSLSISLIANYFNRRLALETR